MPSGSSTPATTTNKAEFADEVKPFVTPLFEQAQGELDRTFGNFYQGDVVASPAPEVFQGLDQLASVANQRVGAGQQSFDLAGDLAQKSQAGNTNQFQAFDASTDTNLLNAAVQGSTANLRESLIQDVLPELSNQAIQGGAYGGGRQNLVQLQAVDDFNENALNIGNTLAFEDASRVRDINAAQAAQRNSLIPQLLQADINQANASSNLLDKSLQQDLFSGNVLRDVGDARTAQNQAILNADIAKFDTEQNAGFDQLSKFAAILAGVPTPSSTTTRTEASTRGGISGAIKGGLGGFLATGNPLGAAAGAAGGYF